MCLELEVFKSDRNSVLFKRNYKLPTLKAFPSPK